MSSSKIKKIHFVLNPKAGYGSPLKIFHQIEEELKSNNVQYTVFKSQGKRDIFHHVMSGDMPVCDVLCSMGGDGTIHETADALMQSGKANDFPMAVIPSGTGNAFAQTLGELQPKKAIRKILQGEAIKIDAMEIKQGAEVSYAVNIIGWGMASKVNQISDQLRALGGIRYNIASLIGIATMKKKRLALRMNQEVIDEDALLFLALNTVYTGKGMKMAPDADFSDGLIDIIMFKSANKLQVINIFLKLFSGKHIFDPRVTYKQVESFSLLSEGDELNIDGENQGSTPIDVRVIKKCITLIK
ncbi:MAG: diacylglycerol kinase family lipid kinase [Gammaproteobacteria bacterium]|nr:diacylglycerol kinase family lipid kinase [Gammaproteobacteria bacterium]